MRLSASAIPRAMRCSASIIEPKIPYDDKNEQAEVGTIVHDLLAKYILGDREDKHLDKNIQELFQQGIDIWEDKLKAKFPDPRPEHGFTTLESIDMSHTTADVVSYIPDKQLVRIADWKTGEYDPDAVLQLKTYALAAAFEYGVKNAEVAIAWIKDDYVEWQSYTLLELTNWHSDIMTMEKNLLKRGPKYTAGTHCKYCPRLTECPAIGNSIALSDSPTGALTPQLIAKYRPIVKKMETMIERFKKAQTAYVSSVGEIETEDEILKLITAKRKTIDHKAAMGYMDEEGIEYDTKTEVLMPSIKKQKGDIIGQLEEYGAIISSVYSYVRGFKKGGKDE